MNRPFSVDPSTTAVFKALKDERPVQESSQSMRAVVVGGGTGAPVSIRTLLSMGITTSAVVAMADDGGSTGILREEANVTPPGDVRKCLAAFAKNPDDPMTKAFKYRFEFASGHVLGNLMLSALEEATESFPEAVQICENLLGARGHVYPSTLDRITLLAETEDGHLLRGQANASKAKTTLKRVRLASPETCTPYSQALQAIEAADILVLGPGSLFTSIIPNLLVPGIIEAIARSRAKTVFVCSLADMQGETRGLSAYGHVDALMNHGMEGLLDFVFVHSPQSLCDGGQHALKKDFSDKETLPPQTIKPVVASRRDIRAIQERGPQVLVRNFVEAPRPTWHNPYALRDALMEVIRACHLPQR